MWCALKMWMQVLLENIKTTPEDNDRTKIINTATKLIKNVISLLEIDRSVYSSITEMIHLDRQLELVPESLKLLLRVFLKSDIKVVF